MKKLLFLSALLAAVLFAAQGAYAQCCDDPDGTGPDTQACGTPTGPDPGEGCIDAGAACIGGDALEAGGPTGCLCVAGTCICNASGSPCPSAAACADAADNACET